MIEFWRVNFKTKEMYEVKAKKYLGQHFLRDEGIAKSIVEALNPDIVNIVEVGPGMGVLTKYLLEREKTNLKVVEIDDESVSFLNTNYPDLDIIAKDFLQLDLEKIFDGKFAVIGNFPYNISTQILFKVLEHRNNAIEVVGMFQKEVAERIAANHGSKTYGITSVLLQLFYDIEYLFTVNENVFSPPPRVKSAVIRLHRNKRTDLPFDEKLVFTVVKTAFNQRRKTLRNALKPIVQNYDGIPFLDKRAEQLSVEDFIILTEAISKAK